MKAWAWMAMVPILGSLAHAESLGDVAKRERERREKKKEGAQAAVIREADLVAGPAKASKGTFSPAAGTPGGRAKAEAAPPSSAPAQKGNAALSEVDSLRVAARERLEATYAAIRDVAWSLFQAVSRYEQCAAAGTAAIKTCRTLLADIGNMAVSIGISMEHAEDAARQGWLAPGEVRDARRRHGMDDAFWDELVRAVQQYRRR